MDAGSSGDGIIPGAGGGGFWINTARIVNLEGGIATNGQHATKTYGKSLPPSGGGAGGSVHITSPYIEGHGSQEANGGNGATSCEYYTGTCRTAYGGGGGGGIIATIALNNPSRDVLINRAVEGGKKSRS
jgi:hypothetical protein